MKKPTEELKETILSRLKANKSVLELAKEYNVSRTTIYRWKKEETEKPDPIMKEK